MGIQPTNAYSALTFNANASQQRQTPTRAIHDTADSVTNPADKTTNISQAARDRAAEETKGGGSFDFTNIAQNEVLDTINTLIKSGRMSLDESTSLLTFVPHPDLNAAMLGSGTPGSASQPINLFSELEKMMAYNKSVHNDGAVIYGQKALSVLQRLQGTNREAG